MGVSDALPSSWPHRLAGVGHQLRRLGHRRHVGAGRRRRVDGGAARGARRGVNFFDTADVYGDGRSERLLARLRRERPASRSTSPPRPAAGSIRTRPTGYSRENLDRVRRAQPREPRDRRDRPAAAPLPADRRLLPARGVRRRSTTWCAQGKLRYYGVSVERVEEALKAIEYPGVQSVQIIFNMFRQRPAELFFAGGRRAARSASWRACRSPSGMLTGKLTRRRRPSPPDDHRSFNRHGEAFDAGETFSGVDYELGLAAVEELRPLVPGGRDAGAVRAALDPDVRRRDLRHPRRRRRPRQADDNVAAADLPPLSAETMAAVQALYDTPARGRGAPAVVRRTRIPHCSGSGAPAPGTTRW